MTGMEHTLNPRISISGISCIQLVAVPDPLQSRGSYVIQQLKVEIPRQSKDGISTELEESSKEIFGESGDIFASHVEVED